MKDRTAPGLPRRLPLAFVLVDWAENALSIVALLVAGVLVHQRASSPEWLLPAMWTLLFLRFLSPIYTWVTLRFATSQDGLWYVRGVLLRRNRYVPWNEVSAVQVDQPFAFRIAGLTRLNLLQGGEDATRVSLQGITRGVCDEIVAHVRDAAADPPNAHTEVPPIESKPLYEATNTDLLAASVIYGKFAVVGAALALGVVDQLQTWGGDDEAMRFVAQSPVIAALLVGLATMILGAIATVVRFAGLRTSRRGDDLFISFGLFSTRERLITSRAVAGIEVRQNLLEVLTGRARLSVLSRDSGARLGTNLVLPSLRIASVEKLTDRVFQLEGYGEWRPSSPAHVWKPFLALVVTSTMACVPVVLLRPAPLLGVAAYVGAFVVVQWGGKVLCSGLETSPDASGVTITTRWISRCAIAIRPEEVHVVSLTRLWGLPPLLRVHFYSGRPRALTARTFDSAELEMLVQGSLELSTGVSPR